jgi:hypothetical protein
VAPDKVHVLVVTALQAVVVVVVVMVVVEVVEVVEVEDGIDVMVIEVAMKVHVLETKVAMKVHVLMVIAKEMMKVETTKELLFQIHHILNHILSHQIPHQIPQIPLPSSKPFHYPFDVDTLQPFLYQSEFVLPEQPLEPDIDQPDCWTYCLPIPLTSSSFVANFDPQ